MADRRGAVFGSVSARTVSDFVGNAKGAERLDFSHAPLGQCDPRHCPEHCPQCPAPNHSSIAPDDPLGGPMRIGEVAALLGCSVWTVRQRYVRQGLPHLRASATGRIVFFREQVIDWILTRQKKGGYRP